MTNTAAMLLGLLQGATEFLPVSSTGHLVLAHILFSVEGSSDLAFDAILHLSTALAVIVYFRRDLMDLFNTLVRKLARLPVNTRDMTLIYALMVGTVPGVIFGLMLESFMATVFRNPLLIAAVLIVGSFLFAYAEWAHLNRPRDERMTVRKGLLIGLFQSLALIPGMSRSGASISGAMLLGLSRSEAARFSFLLAIPIIVGAGGKKLLELATSDTVVNWTAVSLGAVTSFFVGLLAIHFMLTFVRRHTLWPFIWYRIILATLVILLVYFG